MRVVFTSDTHNYLHLVSVPDGDVLVHCGDATMHGKQSELLKFSKEFSALPHKVKIFVAGNHDESFEYRKYEALSYLDDSITYLEDSELVVDGVKFYGSPWQPKFYDWAFNLSRGLPLAEKWAMIPEDTNVLITHGPPYGIGDSTYGVSSFLPEHVGCQALRLRVAALSKLNNLKVHAFGHIHEGYGLYTEESIPGIKFINASACDAAYHPLQEPIVVDL